MHPKIQSEEQLHTMEKVFGSGFKYIAIRNMMVPESVNGRQISFDVEKARKLFSKKPAEYESIRESIKERFHLVQKDKRIGVVAEMRRLFLNTS